MAYYKDTSGNLKIDRTTHYYPFGLEFGGDLNISLSLSPNYKYSSQGQEKQLETGWSSYRWRNYDAAMGRFFNVDPLSEKYAYQSHYNFSENRVVDGRELEGLEWIPLPAYGVGAMTPPPMYSGKAGAGSSIYETAKGNAINNYNGLLRVIGTQINVVAAVSTTGLVIAKRVLNSEGDSKAENGNNKSKGTEGNEITISDENKIPRDSLDPPTKPGNAPTFKKDGKTVEIHHEGQKAEGPFKEMHPTDHRGKGNYSKNHPKGQKPLSKQERIEFNNARQKYWKKEYPNVKNK